MDTNGPRDDDFWEDEDFPVFATASELSAWSMRQHSIRMARESFLRTMRSDALQPALQMALVDRSRYDFTPDELTWVAGDDEALLDVVDLHVGPEQAELDIHLGGPGVRGHATDAKKFSEFVSKLTATVAETARNVKGHKRSRSNLLIEGAMPGSVRVVLKAPTATRPSPAAPTLFEVLDASTADSVALRNVADLLERSSSADSIDDNELSAALALIPPRAHTLLRGAVSTATSADWEISGVLRQRGIGRREVTLTKRGASRLTTVLQPVDEEIVHETLRARPDGHKPSDQRMWIIPSGQDRSIPVLVRDASLWGAVRELNAPEEPAEVEVVLRTTSRLSKSSGRVLSKVRELMRISPLDA